MAQLEDTSEASTIFDALTGALLLRFDLNLSEKFTGDADVTSYPVEDGGRVSDDTQLKQDMFELTAEVTNTPVDAADVVEQRARRAFEVVVDLHRQRARLVVTAGLRVFGPCILKSYSAPRDFKTAQTLVVTLNFVRVDVVTLASTEVPASILAALKRAGGKSKTNKTGKDKPPTEQQAAARNKSVAKRAADFIADVEF